MTEFSTEKWEELAEKWLKGTITPAEQQLFDHWYEQDPGLLIHMDARDADLSALKTRLLERLQDAIHSSPASPTQHRSVIPWRTWTAVAAAVSILVIATWLWTRTGNSQAPAIAHQPTTTDIIPGRNQAILTLADNRKIILDSTVQGPIDAAAVNYITNSNGLLTYTAPTSLPASNTSQYHTLTTARGNQYRLILPDGTRVWLDAASSITYPACFNGRERKVSMTGEAYFEVTHSDKMPFKVQVRGHEIEDLGTHFNIDAYTEEPRLRTTLLEGSVKIGSTILHPGEQAGIDATGSLTVTKDADLDQAIAWKNGLFQFDHADIRTVMDQLSRWYDVDIRYEGQPAARQFGGKISRFSNITEVLKVLEFSQVHCRLENKTIVVLP